MVWFGWLRPTQGAEGRGQGAGSSMSNIIPATLCNDMTGMAPPFVSPWRAGCSWPWNGISCAHRVLALLQRGAAAACLLVSATCVRCKPKRLGGTLAAWQHQYQAWQPCPQPPMPAYLLCAVWITSAAAERGAHQHQPPHAGVTCTRLAGLGGHMSMRHPTNMWPLSDHHGKAIVSCSLRRPAASLISITAPHLLNVAGAARRHAQRRCMGSHVCTAVQFGSMLGLILGEQGVLGPAG